MNGLSLKAGSCCTPITKKAAQIGNGLLKTREYDQVPLLKVLFDGSSKGPISPKHDCSPKRAPLSQSFTMETMLSFADSDSSQDEADDEEESEEDEKENELEDPVEAGDVGDFKDLRNGKSGGHRNLSLVRTEFSSQPDLPTFIQVSTQLANCCNY